MTERPTSPIAEALEQAEVYDLNQVLRRAGRAPRPGQLNPIEHEEVFHWDKVLRQTHEQLWSGAEGMRNLSGGTNYWRTSKNPVFELSGAGVYRNVFLIANKPIDTADMAIYGLQITDKSALKSIEDVNLPPALMLYSSFSRLYVADSPLLCPELSDDIEWKMIAEELIKEAEAAIRQI